MTHLASLDQLPEAVAGPAYCPADHGVGIVHIGLGAFMRAHLAVYTDGALAETGGDWRITGVGLRSKETVDALNAQHGLYCLLVRGERTTARVPGALAQALHAPTAPEAVMAALVAPGTRIVSLTITEKGYGIDPDTGGLDKNRPEIAADLASDLSTPKSAVGWIVASLGRRRASGLGPFTVMSCDNLASNGVVLRRLVLEFARVRDGDLAEWIVASASFPSTMVDRITPAPKAQTLADARTLLGVADHAAIETEPFSQWVIEDDFCAGRPAWEKAGAIMTGDVAPYERMKLRMLNGAHSLLAYCGFLAGYDLVRDVMAAPELAARVDRHMQAAADSLDAIEGVDLSQYRRALLKRFANPAIAHPTCQIAMDGSQKMPPRIFETALDIAGKEGDLSSFAFATAAWLAYLRGFRDDGQTYDIRDPRQAEIATALARGKDRPGAIMAEIFALKGLVPPRLADSRTFRDAVARELARIMNAGMRAAIRDV